MRKILLLFLSFVWGLALCAQATFSIDGLKIKQGEKLQIAIRMTATEDIKGFQMDVHLPEGLSFEAQNSKPVLELTSWGENHTLSSKIQPDGFARFIVVSMSGDIFAAGDKPVMMLNVIASEDIQPGNYNILLKDIVVSRVSGTKLKIAEIVNPIKIYQEFEIKAIVSTGGTVTGAGTYELGTEATLTAIPDEGYRFVKWSDEVEDNPYTFVVDAAKDLTAVFEPKKYEIVYSLDGVVFQKDLLAFGSTITTPEVPAKEGHTFTGWMDVPKTMPAGDIAVTGGYTVNSYILIYTVDGVEYKKENIAYGTTITPEAIPVKEGHTFDGWSEIPATMPANDVTIAGSFTVNIYKVTFTIDDETIAEKDVVYGTAIETPEAPVKEGYTFAGWADVPVIMPAGDIEIAGSYTVNIYHVIYKVDGEVYQTVEVTYGETIVLIAEPVKEGYAFTGWSAVPETMPAYDVEVTGGFIVSSISVLMKLPELVDVYTLDGIMIKGQISSESLERELPKGIYIINGRKIMIGYTAY